MTKEERGQTLPKADGGWMKVLARAASGSRFLLGCTVFEVPAAVLGVLALNGFDALGSRAVVLFLVFLAVVVVGMVGVGYQNLRQNVREFRENSGAPSRLKDSLTRGIGK